MVSTRRNEEIIYVECHNWLTSSVFTWENTCRWRPYGKYEVEVCGVYLWRTGGKGPPKQWRREDNRVILKQISKTKDGMVWCGLDSSGSG
jgi:hypothetical protein